MKQPIKSPSYFLLLFIFLISCREFKTTNEVENYTEVHINFNDYSPSKHKSFIDLKIENGVNPIIKQLKISDSGTVSYNFINDRKRELLFNYENREFSLIVSPSERLYAKSSIEELIDWKSKLEGFKVSSGQNKQTNNLILANISLIDSLVKEATWAFSRNEKSVDIDYKKKRISEMRKQLGAFESIIKAKNLNDKTFLNWGKAQIRYRAGYDLSLFPFFGTVNKDMDEENNYFDFVMEVNPKQNDELTYQSYLKYLETLATSYKIMSNIAEKYSSEREQLKKDNLSNFPILFKMIKKLPQSNERELLMAYLYKNNKQVPENYLDSLKYVVNEKLLAQVELSEENEIKDIITLIKNYDIPESEKTNLLKLYIPSEGKVIYHDFWFTNCAPCMQELPYYNDLIDASDQNEVEFIFYGVYMENEEWKKTIEKFKLKGKHHLLTKNQLAFFEKYFKVHGFPHHHILHPDGIIGEEVRLGVYPDNFKAIYDLIKKHKTNENDDT